MVRPNLTLLHHGEAKPHIFTPWRGKTSHQKSIGIIALQGLVAMATGESYAKENVLENIFLFFLL